MKKPFPQNVSTINGGVCAFLKSIVFFCFLCAPYAWATSELDHRYRLESIGYLKSWDNVDGLFSEYVDSVYKEYFAQTSRFTAVNLSQADPVFSRSKLPYKKIIRDHDILEQLVRTAHVDSLIRTEILKEGNEYTFILDWLHAPSMNVLATHRFTMIESPGGGSFGTNLIAEPLRQNLGILFSRVPFAGHVTGRDHLFVTVNMGLRENLKKGQILVLGTLDEAKKHPLLGTLVDWKLTPTGKVIVEQVEEGMAFCKVLEEEPGKEISRYQKIIQIQDKTLDSQETSTLAPETQNRSQNQENEVSKLGWMRISLPLGSYSRQLSSPSNSVTYSGTGFALGGKADGQLWLTQNWFFDLGLDYRFWNFTQKNNNGALSPISSAGGAQGSLFSLRLDFGYAYLLRRDPLGPKGWLKAGYKSDSYSLPISAAELIGPMTFGSAFLGVGGDLPLPANWGIQANFNYSVFSSVSQSWLNRSSSGASDVELQIGGYYRFTRKMTFGCTFEILASSANFSASTGLSQNTMTFAPFLLYYF